MLNFLTTFLFAFLLVTDGILTCLWLQQTISVHPEAVLGFATKPILNAQGKVALIDSNYHQVKLVKFPTSSLNKLCQFLESLYEIFKDIDVDSISIISNKNLLCHHSQLLLHALLKKQAML